MSRRGFILGLAGAALFAGWLAIASPACAQATIVLRDRVKLSPGTSSEVEASSTLTLGQIADISGGSDDDIARLSDTVVPSRLSKARASEAIEVSIDEVRSALEARSGGINWGRVALSGSTCRVEREVAAPKPPPPKPSGVTKPMPAPIDLAGPPTLRTMLALRLAELYSVAAQDLRLSFDPADDSVLDTPIGSSHVDLHPAAGPGTPRVPVHVSLYDHDRVVLSRVITPTAVLRRSVLTATSPIDRGDIITQSQLNQQDQWLAPGTRPSSSMEQAVGSVANTRISAGQIVAQTDISAPLVVKRGETVYVHALGSNVTVKVKARAMAPARDGELVQLKLDGSERTFTARMSGKGRAVLVVGDSGEPEPGPNVPRLASVQPTPTRKEHAR